MLCYELVLFCFDSFVVVAATAAVVDTAFVGRQFDTRGRKGEINTKDRD